MEKLSTKTKPEPGLEIELKPVNYLRQVANRQRKAPVLLYKRDSLVTALEERGGGFSIIVADALNPDQINGPLYFGATTPQNDKEVPHWHRDQEEAYVVMDGECELVAKWRWEDDGWERLVGKPGDVLIARRESCHWLVWRSERGLALAFKSPQIPGEGASPAGKTTCLKGCPHFNNGCRMPVSSAEYRFTPEVANKA